eukprot:7482747-Alexandrium_andersonii.AAC.1
MVGSVSSWKSSRAGRLPSLERPTAAIRMEPVQVLAGREPKRPKSGRRPRRAESTRRHRSW